MNYGLEENLTLTILGLLEMSAIYTQGWGEPKKVNAKSNLGIFLDYSTMSKAYMVYN